MLRKISLFLFLLLPILSFAQKIELDYDSLISLKNSYLLRVEAINVEIQEMDNEIQLLNPEDLINKEKSTIGWSLLGAGIGATFLGSGLAGGESKTTDVYYDALANGNIETADSEFQNIATYRGLSISSFILSGVLLGAGIAYLIKGYENVDFQKYNEIKNATLLKLEAKYITRASLLSKIKDIDYRLNQLKNEVSFHND